MTYFIKKIEENKIVFICCLFLTFGFFINLIYPTGDIDLIYNSYFARAFKDGLLPYKDFSVTMTPLSFVMTAGLLKIKDSMAMVSFIGIVFAYITTYALYKIACHFTNSKSIAFTIAVIGNLLYMSTSTINCNYNMMAVAFLFLLISHFMSNKDYKKFSYLLMTTILCSFGCWTKQNYGLYLCIYSYIFYLIFKKDRKEALKFTGLMLLLNVPILFLIYKASIFNYFYAMCFKGVTSFAKSLSILSVAFIIASIFSSYFLFKKKNTSRKIFAVGLLISILFLYPNANEAHLLYILPLLFVLIGLIPFLKYKDYLNIIAIVGFSVCSVLFVKTIAFQPLDIDAIQSDASFYDNVRFDNEDNFLIEVISEYKSSQSIPVYLLNEKATSISLATKEYKKYLDLFFVGNLGNKGPVAILKEQGECLFIIPKNSNERFWQTPKNAYNYVKTLEYVEDITFDFIDNTSEYEVYKQN